jgi:nitroreductase
MIMDMITLIRTRKSVRTFDERVISDTDREKLTEYINTITNPYDIPIDLVLMDAKEHGLSSPVIQGGQLYIAGKVPKVEHCEEAFGYTFEKMVLYAWSLGIGTTWIGRTMDRKLFEREAGVKNGEIMPCVSPLGYPAKKRSLKETAMRAGIKADKRKQNNELFFENDFDSPLNEKNDIILKALEAVRLSPSAVNKQPWRIVKCGNKFHFYEKHTLNRTGSAWDVQKVDMGIAVCHFMTIIGGKLSFEQLSADVPDDTEYIATVQIDI